MYSHNAENRKILGSILRDIRLSHHLTQEELGKRIKSTRAYISSFETGTRMPSKPIMKKLSVALDMNPDQLELQYLYAKRRIITKEIHKIELKWGLRLSPEEPKGVE